MANPAPIGYYLSPAKIPAAGGVPLQVVGRDIDNVSVAATVGGTAVATVVAQSRFLLNMRAPAHAAGPVNVVVTTTDGSFTMTGAVTYV